MVKVPLSRLGKGIDTRTMLYGDQEFSALELQLWHTAVFQRLYFIRQLGFSDKVFPDAVHNRFNHVLGACQRAEDILIAASRTTDPALVPSLVARSSSEGVAAYIERRIDTARLMALLHDLSHIPFGHTLEDEVHLFATKHDAHARQVKMFNRITSQMIWGLYDDVVGQWPTRWQGSDDPARATRLAGELVAFSTEPNAPRVLTDLRPFLVNLNAAQVALIAMHHPTPPESPALFLPKLLKELNIEGEEFSSVHDHFLIDAIGNTICADLLDYSRRDMRMANIAGDYDDRIFKWFALAEDRRRGEPATRLAIKVFSSKFKPDIVREIMRILEIRYDLSERILFHPAKCCAGAMLGRALSTLCLGDSVDEMLAMGDEGFLSWVERQLSSLEAMLLAASAGDMERAASAAEALHPLVNIAYSPTSEAASKEPAETPPMRDVAGQLEQVQAALAIWYRLRSRHYFNNVFEVSTEADDERGMNISASHRDSQTRAALERGIESHCHLPPGTVLIHCPRRETNFKEAEVLVLHSPDCPPIALCKAGDVPILKRHAQRAADLANDYKSIWRLRVFLHPSYRAYAASVVDYVRYSLRVDNTPYLELKLREWPEYVDAAGFLAEFGGNDGRHAVGAAASEMMSARMGTGGQKPTFAECLDRQAESRRRRQ